MLVEVVATHAEDTCRFLGAEREPGAERRRIGAPSLTQTDLSERSGRDRAQIARWESDSVQPSFETLRELVRACGFDLALALVPYDLDEGGETRLREKLFRSPENRLHAMLKERNR